MSSEPVLSSFPMAQQSLVGQGLLFIEASRSHSDALHAVGFCERVTSPTQRPLAETVINTELY